MRMRAKAVFIGIGLLVLAACSREQQDWRSAQGADTIEAYSRFVEEHPQSALAKQARARVVQLQEERAWDRASQSDTADAYRQFLTDHPNGKWAEEARIRIESFALGEAPAPAELVPAATRTPVVSSPSPASVVTPGTNVYPDSVSDAAPAAPTAFGIQLGAFSDEYRAENEWQRLVGRFANQLANLTPSIVPARTGAGQVFRLQASVSDEAEARSICAQLSTQLQSCVVVLPRRVDANR
jgi:hypothetical protein